MKSPKMSPFPLFISRISLASVFMLGSVALMAALPTPPLATGDLLSEPTFVAKSWKLSPGVTLSSEGITAISEDSNPSFVYQKNFQGDVLLQARLQNVDANHNLHVIVSSFFSLRLTKEGSGETRITAVALNEDGSAKSPTLFDRVFIDQPYAAIEPSDFVLTLALRGEKATAWIDQQKIAEFDAPGLPRHKRFSFQSGWRSDWTLADFAIRGFLPLR